MRAYGKAAITLGELEKSEKMADIRSVIQEVSETGANVVLVVNEMLGTIREGIFIATVLRNEGYEVKWHKQGILVTL
ncbi:hypothetical protein [Planococcus halotolerans]|uniref:Uncharacterized protein n=2 Tax=Planococcus halotolerans TaxID=2233542 RepID=A0A365KKM6_9BACL|nr:hypothetical protein DP120_16840 [Planococcus halotolerans]